MLPEEYVLFIIGSPQTESDKEYFKSLEKRISGNARVKHVPYVDGRERDVAFGASDVFLFPYRKGTSSAALLNALAYGKPAICSRLSAFAQI